MRKFTSIIVAAVCLVSCVSQEQYDTLQHEHDKLAAELKEIKFGVPTLLADGKRLFETEQYDLAKTKLDEIVNKHSDRPESGEAKKMLEVIAEELMWQHANQQATLEKFQNYVAKLPDGKYVGKSKSIIKKLRIAREEQEYEEAVAANSSAKWKAFLDNYPNRVDRAAIEREIIRCEVREIAGSSETGQLPASNQTGFSNSASSTISIKNDTECNLIVRYSGPQVKRIDIAAGATEEVYLPSGSYQIAATACGEHYAGSEHLSGEYSSRYYIVTRRF